MSGYKVAQSFDHVVIGTSPMMLLQAHALAETGASVCVVDRNERPGGAWQTALVGQGTEVEIASHVIEAFPGVYEYLEAISGVPFVTLEAQPVRVSRKGNLVPYFGRAMLFLAGARMALGLGFVQIRQVLGRDQDDNDLINYRNKFGAFLRFQLRYLWRKAPMKGPRDGFVDFMERLLARAREVGVQFSHMDVDALIRDDSGWQVRTVQGHEIHTDHVHATTSCGLMPKGEGNYRAVPVVLEDRVAVIVDIACAGIRLSQTYAAFWRDPKISRISRIDSPGDLGTHERFLIELRSPALLQSPDLDQVLRNRLERARILFAGREFLQIGIVFCKATQNTDQLPRGALAKGFHTYYSNGNLAAGLAYWLRFQKPQ